LEIPRGYVKIPANSVGIAFRQLIKNELTIVADSTSSFTSEDVVHHLYSDNPPYIGVPRGFYLQRLKHRGVPGEFTYSLGGAFNQHAREFTLRPGQPEIIEKALSVLKKHDYGGVVIEAGVASGKTLITLEIARQLGLKTIIIVPTSVLMDQWIKEIKRFFPMWKVGKVFGDTFEVKGYDVCVAMLQSMAMKDDYPAWFYEEFGTIISDETHLLGAPEFAKGIPRFGARYMIGASGTVRRKDKCEKVFIYTIGEVIPFMHAVKTMQPEVFFIDTGFSWSGWGALDRQKSQGLKQIIADPGRNAMIVRQAVRASKVNRNVLILTERKVHAKELYGALNQQFLGSPYSAGLMLGETKQDVRDVSQKANVIIATVQLIGTGFNEPRLDTLIFATPVQNIDQCVGRIRREHPGKKTPFVLDPVDTRSEAGMIFAKSRFKKYLAQGWKLHGIECFPKEFLWKYKKELSYLLPNPNVRTRSGT